ncbi:MAG: hypothetical protein WC661_09080 [Opitutaceae bacterium]|jgi:hypothetical protein
MRRAFILMLGCLLLAGCATRTGDKPPSPVVKSGGVIPSPFAVVGHVLDVDANTGNIIIDVAPYTVLPADFSGKIMLTRTEADLRPTAKLEASPYLRGHILGAHLLAGRPNIGDEVVLPPAER